MSENPFHKKPKPLDAHQREALRDTRRMASRFWDHLERMRGAGLLGQTAFDAAEQELRGLHRLVDLSIRK